MIDEDLPVTMKLDDLRPLVRTFGCGPLDDLVVETITIDLKRRKVTKKHLKIVRSGHFFIICFSILFDIIFLHFFLLYIFCILLYDIFSDFIFIYYIHFFN